ncbi:hypothetical protein HNR39_003378 [Glaciimonas immobilis]|uniref:Uncharacterized protein n=1 Tax=Glaciimonas immobilis TaxID=728004 RepID=A0A840RUK8_9BURK|nr:hypothetical protein [Glaciimonas immobilis]
MMSATFQARPPMMRTGRNGPDLYTAHFLSVYGLRHKLKAAALVSGTVRFLRASGMYCSSACILIPYVE